MAGLTESVVEDAALAWLEGLGYAVKHGPDKSPAGDTLTLAPPQRRGKVARKWFWRIGFARRSCDSIGATRRGN